MADPVVAVGPPWRPPPLRRARRPARAQPLPLARIMHETPERDRGDGRATGQPSRGTAGLALRRTFLGTSQGSRPNVPVPG
jgi:hypothetical protein